MTADPIFFPVRFETAVPMDELPWRSCDSLAHADIAIQWRGPDLRCPLCRALNEHEAEVERLEDRIWKLEERLEELDAEFEDELEELDA